MITVFLTEYISVVFQMKYNDQTNGTGSIHSHVTLSKMFSKIVLFHSFMINTGHVFKVQAKDMLYKWVCCSTSIQLYF